MKVIALEKGFFAGAPIDKGQQFDVPDGRKAAWYAPVDAAAKADKAPKAADKAPKTLSETGNAKAKSFNEAMKPDLA